MGTLLNRLLIILNNGKESSTYYHIAYILLCNYDSIADMTISEVAELCFVSKSTISKFTRHIGFEDFLQLKTAATEKSDKKSNNLNYNNNINILPSYLSKGLEFDAVIIVGKEKFNKNNKLDMKLLYVSMTRALHKLIVK